MNGRPPCATGPSALRYLGVKYLGVTYLQAGLPMSLDKTLGGGAKQPAAGTKISVLPLVALIYFEVSGGPYGIEDAVGAAGPLYALLGCLVFPLVWSIPGAI
eukprot:SAG31_NODE_453_length_15464_cov_37.074064_16_plen_102_part_00